MLLDAWRLAVGTLTAVPVRPPTLVERQRAAAAMVLAPFAVLPLGLAVTVVACAGRWLELPPLVTALLAVGSVILGSRALHLDGLSDTVDGLAASYDRERSLSVMKSGTSGPAGVVAVVLVLGLQVASLASLSGSTHWWRVAILAGAVVCMSRAALVVCCAHGVPSARSDGLGRTFTETVPRPVAAAVWATVAVVLGLLGVAAGLPWWRGVLAAVLALVVVLVVVARVRQRFGGVTGDVFGASIECALAAMLIALA